MKLTIEQEGGVQVDDLVKITDGDNKSCNQVEGLNIYKGNIIKPGKIYFSVNYDSKKKKKKIIDLKKGMGIIREILKLKIDPNIIFNFKINNGIDVLWNDLGKFPILRNLKIQLSNDGLEQSDEVETFINENTTHNLNKDLQINVSFNKLDKNGIRNTNNEPVNKDIIETLLKNIISIIESN